MILKFYYSYYHPYITPLKKCPLVISVLFLITIKHLYLKNECKDKLKFSALVSGAFIIPIVLISYISSLKMSGMEVLYASDNFKYAVRNGYFAPIIWFVLLAGLVFVRLEYLFDHDLLNMAEAKVLEVKTLILANLTSQMNKPKEK